MVSFPIWHLWMSVLIVRSSRKRGRGVPFSLLLNGFVLLSLLASAAAQTAPAIAGPAPKTVTTRLYSARGIGQCLSTTVVSRQRELVHE
jgi:hypothetical protein